MTTDKPKEIFLPFENGTGDIAMDVLNKQLTAYETQRKGIEAEYKSMLERVEQLKLAANSVGVALQVLTKFKEEYERFNK